MTTETMQLEVFQDLFLRGPPNARASLRQALLDHAMAPWRHAGEVHKDPSIYGNEADVLTFKREAGEGLAEATLVLWPRPEGYEVTNIVPIDVRELGYSGYNAILQDFLRRIAVPAARQTGFEVETTAPRQSIEEWIPAKTAEALRRFSRSANKGTGSSHPLDRQRWFEFLIQAHADQRRIDTERLVRWLVEVDGWSDYSAHELAIEYEFGLDLLGEYDKRRH
jgi:hypothetical protein